MRTATQFDTKVLRCCQTRSHSDPQWLFGSLEIPRTVLPCG